MSTDNTAAQSVRRARFEADAAGVMAARYPRQHALRLHFERESSAYVELQGRVIDYHCSVRNAPEQAADALASLIDRMLETMSQSLQQQAA